MLIWNLWVVSWFYISVNPLNSQFTFQLFMNYEFSNKTAVYMWAFLTLLTNLFIILTN